jgi:hypothetical protein
VSGVGRNNEGSCAQLVLWIDVGAKVEQRDQRLELVRACRLMERGVAAVVLAVDIRAAYLCEKSTRRRVSPE